MHTPRFVAISHPPLLGKVVCPLLPSAETIIFVLHEVPLLLYYNATYFERAKRHPPAKWKPPPPTGSGSSDTSALGGGGGGGGGEMTASAGGGGVMSSKDLAHRLELVSEEASTVRAMLFDAIRGQHAALSKDGGSFDCSGEAERRFGALKQKVGMAAAGTDSQGGLTPLISSAATHGADLQRQAQSCQMMVDALGKVVRIGELLEAVDSALAACKFRTSAKSMVEAEAELLEVGSAAAADASADGGGAGQCDGTVVRALRQMTRKRRTSLEGALRDCATAAIVIEPGHISVIKSLEGFFCGRNFRTSVPLSDILESLQELDLLDDFLSTLADRIRRCLCDPVVAGGNFPPAAVVRDEAKSSLRCSPPASSPPPSGGTGLGTSESSLQLPAQLARLTTILSFIHEEVMQKKLAPTACLGNALLCPSGDSGLLGVCLASLRQSVPSSVHGLAAFEQLSAPCADFENRLFEMGFIGEKERGQLQGFVARADEQFASARRTAILAAARATLLGDYHNSVPAGGGTELQMHAGEWGPTQAALQAAGTGSNKKKGGSGVRLFVFEPCQVTSVAKEIIDMAHAALLEACGGGGGEDTTKTVTVPPIAAKELFRTARDIFELFRAVVPVHHRDQVRVCSVCGVRFSSLMRLTCHNLPR